MLNIPEDKVYVLYEHEDLREELTFKDILFNMVYDIKHFLGINISFDKFKEIINQDILNKYLDYLINFLDPYLNNFNIILNTKEIFNKYKNFYVNNIPNEINIENHTQLLDIFLNELLNIDYIKDEYYSY